METRVTNFRLTDEDIEVLDQIREFKQFPTRSEALRYALKIARDSFVDDQDMIYEACMNAPSPQIRQAYQTMFGEPMKESLTYEDAVSSMIGKQGYRTTLNLIQRSK